MNDWKGLIRPLRAYIQIEHQYDEMNQLVTLLSTGTGFWIWEFDTPPPPQPPLFTFLRGQINCSEFCYSRREMKQIYCFFDTKYESGWPILSSITPQKPNMCLCLVCHGMETTLPFMDQLHRVSKIYYTGIWYTFELYDKLFKHVNSTIIVCNLDQIRRNFEVYRHLSEATHLKYLS